MNSTEMTFAARLREWVFGFGAMALLLPVLLAPAAVAEDSAALVQSRSAVEQMRVAASQIAAGAWQSEKGRESTFKDLAARVSYFDQQKSLVEPEQLASELSVVDVAWQPIKRAAQMLIDAGPAIVYVDQVAEKYGTQMDSMQREFSAVADVVRDQKYGSATEALAQKNLWLNERFNRNFNIVRSGANSSESVTRALRADAAEMLGNMEALTRGDEKLGIVKVSDPTGVSALSSAFRKFSAVSTALDRIIADAPKLREAAASREAILSSIDSLDQALDALAAGVNELVGDRVYEQSATPLAYLLVPVLLAVGLVLLQYLYQRRRTLLVTRGATEINGALKKIASGDLSVRVSQDSGLLADISRQVNDSTGQQRELIDNIRAPFLLSVEEIHRIGISARSLVEKGKELTRSVDESIKAATEMVRTSEEIKTATAEASRTSDRNCQQVAQGYELTKDMSRASVDVRESVQETSKSAKRQGELIQSVTAAAEYIQALNTKISVVAINIRIEAEKAGEYGRPFLGIAEAIADLLREAGEESRKIISEVRMLQNMSAENLASMENTVGTVVTILEYIERLDGSLEEINSGSDAISSIIRSVDNAAGQSAISALHMNSSMTQMRERNMEIGKFSESTRTGVARLQRTMRDASESLGQFKLGSDAPVAEPVPAQVEGLERIAAAPRVYREEDMSALESAERARASV